MKKPADNAYPLHDLIAGRWSPRAFANRDISDGDLRSVLEAARWAASCFNEQPWRFIVARRQDGDAFGKLLACLAEANQVWAKHAAVLMISVASTTFARNGKPNRHAYHDVGLAAAQLSLQAESLGLRVHQMAGFSVDQARETFGIPATCEPVAALALGYPGDAQSLPEGLRERESAPRERRAQDEFVFTGRWGDAL